LVDYESEQNHLLNEELRHFKSLNLIQKINLSFEQIICVEENIKHQDYVLLTVQTDTNYRGLVSNVNFYCYTLTHGMYAPEKVMRMFTELVYSQNYGAVEKIEIVDIIGIPNMGYGSIIMNVFFEYIKQFHATEVYGVLSSVDEIDTSNKERRNHFYIKHGFEIKDGFISKKLNHYK